MESYTESSMTIIKSLLPILRGLKFLATFHTLLLYAVFVSPFSRILFGLGFKARLTQSDEEHMCSSKHGIIISSASFISSKRSFMWFL
jgi:hypothetical protein